MKKTYLPIFVVFFLLCGVFSIYSQLKFVVPPIKGTYTFTNSVAKFSTNIVTESITNIITEKRITIANIIYETNTITVPQITTEQFEDITITLVPSIIEVVVQDAITPQPPPPTNDFSGIVVAPNGTSLGSGTLASPLDIRSALNKNHAKIISATKRKIWLRGGTYRDVNIQPSLIGDASNYWEVAPYNNEIVKFDADTRINFILHFANSATIPKYVRFKNLEFLDSRTTKVLGDSYRQLVKLVYADFIEFVHCSFHDSQSSGILVNSSVINLNFYGCYLYANGVDTKFDHAIYFAHGYNGKLALENCLLINNANTSFHGYTSGTDSYKAMANISLVDNGVISLLPHEDRPILFWADTSSRKVTSNCVARGNYVYNLVRVSDASENHRNSVVFRKSDNAVFSNNVLWNAGLIVHEPNRGQFTDNTIVYDAGGNTTAIGVENRGTTSTWNNNKYFLDSSTRFYSGGSAIGSSPIYDFSAWKAATGYDINSSVAMGKPTQNYVKVIKSKYDPNIIHVMIFNFQNLDSVGVDFSAILSFGNYVLKHVGQPDIGSVPTVYSGGNINFNMNGLKYVNSLHKTPSTILGPKAVGFFIIKKV